MNESEVTEFGDNVGELRAEGVGKRGRGRPSRFSGEVMEALGGMIRREGMAEGAAARRLGVPKATLSRWRVERAGFAQALAEARAGYQQARMEAVRQELGRVREERARAGWRGSARLLQRMFPQEYGEPARRLRALQASPERRLAGQGEEG